MTMAQPTLQEVPESPYIEGATLDLIMLLLEIDPVKRVGGKEGPTFEEIQSHTYFEGINWPLLHLRAIDVPGPK